MFASVTNVLHMFSEACRVQRIRSIDCLMKWKEKIITEPRFLYYEDFYTIYTLSYFIMYNIISEKFCNCFFFFFINETARLRYIPTCIICRNVSGDAFLRRKQKRNKKKTPYDDSLINLVSSYLSR